MIRTIFTFDSYELSYDIFLILVLVCRGALELYYSRITLLFLRLSIEHITLTREV